MFEFNQDRRMQTKSLHIRICSISFKHKIEKILLHVQGFHTRRRHVQRQKENRILLLLHVFLSLSRIEFHNDWFSIFAEKNSHSTTCLDQRFVSCGSSKNVDIWISQVSSFNTIPRPRVSSCLKIIDWFLCLSSCVTKILLFDLTIFSLSRKSKQFQAFWAV